MLQIKRLPSAGYNYIIAKRDTLGRLSTFHSESERSKFRFNKDGKTTIFNKRELRDIRISKGVFILRVSSKKFKQLYTIEYSDGDTILKDRMPYDTLYRKCLEAVKKGA